MLLVYIRITLRPYRAWFCVPPAMTTVFVLSLSLSVSLKQANPSVCLCLAAIALDVDLKEMSIDFAPSGSSILPGVVSTFTPRCVFSRRSRLHGLLDVGNHSCTPLVVFSIFVEVLPGLLIRMKSRVM